MFSKTKARSVWQRTFFGVPLAQRLPSLWHLSTEGLKVLARHSCYFMFGRYVPARSGAEQAEDRVVRWISGSYRAGSKRFA
jgi:hypothetical protein